MDTDSLSFSCEEHFSTFGNYFNIIDDESQSLQETAADQNVWDWEVERELNGDVALIPMSSELGMDYLTNSPPIKEDLHKIMSDWQHLMNIEIPDIDDLTSNMALTSEEENVIYLADTLSNPLPPTVIVPTSSSSPSHLGFSTDHEQKQTNFKLTRPSGKKIDMTAQCYIVEENESKTLKTEKSEDDDDDSSSSSSDDDNDSSSGSSSSSSSSSSSDDEDDIKIKTEEFIDVEETKTDIQNKSEEFIDVGENEICPKLEENLELTLPIISDNNQDGECDYVDVDTISNQDTPILQAGDLNSLLEQFEATETTKYHEPAPEPPADEELFEFQAPTPPAPVTPSETVTNIVKEDESDKNKQILNALPQELIMRIKASSKRKMISVIDPIPAKRRGIKRAAQVEVPQPPQENKVEKCTNPESVQLDHDYCSLVTPYPKNPKKDSGFESAEEDEQRNIFKNQPTVKRADGKLMVSLLKINTIRNSIALNDINSNSNKKKRKLNLEEYKKRRVGVNVTSRDNSQNNSPNTSGRNSPAIILDEHERLLKHQQKLMQMAEEVLKTPPKSAISKTLPSEESIPAITPLKDFAVPPPPRVPPNNVDVKVLVSIGVNTDATEQSLASKRFNNVPIKEIEKIKPLLKKSSTKISNNSLITSVLENIQQSKKKMTKQNLSSVCAQSELKQTNVNQQEHGEDKTILHLDKNRPPIVTVDVGVQTDIVEEIINRRDKRKRNTSSSSSDDYRKIATQRSSSIESHYSYTSQSSSSSSSGSRSRSRSPSRSRKMYTRRRPADNDRELIREVEERRIVYVGGISSTMTKEALRRRFQQYGPINNVSIHFREYGDNYGFVTFAYKVDAYEAVEHGNDDPTLPRYDLSFGGRRIFCRSHYADLDNVQDELGYGSGQAEDSFDNLLREAQAKLRKRKACT